MPRDEEETGRNGGRTRAALVNGGHAAGGGHTTGKGRSPVQHAILSRAARQQNRPAFWDHDDDEGLDGDDMDYEYQEYPKAVYPWGQEGPSRNWRSVRVESAAEEAEAMAQGDLSERDEEKRERFLAIAEVKGLKLDKRWGLDKMEAAIVAAGHDPSLDPSK